MREIVLDTETTGLDPDTGDRIVEIACVELVRRIPSGRVWHEYFNPERDMPEAAFAVHGLSTEFLSDKPKFAELAPAFVEFISDAKLVIHNAAFDVKFLNAEFARLGLAPIMSDAVIDTLAIARRKHPGAQNSLDALCRRYNIDNSARTKHGALLDAELLAEVYLNLIDAQQPALDFVRMTQSNLPSLKASGKLAARPEPLPPRITEAEQAAHSAFMAGFKVAPLWTAYGLKSKA